MAHFHTIRTTAPYTARWFTHMMLCAALCTNLVGVLFPLAWANSAVGLVPAEQRIASQLATNQAWPQERQSITHRPHVLGVQTLSIELDERKKGERARRARVYQFNYHLFQSRLVLIDLDSAIIVKQQIIDSVHLPLNAAEIAMARNLVEQQADIMAKINQSQLQRGSAQLVDLSTIEVKASIFEPDNNQHSCAKQRCALISLFDQTRTVFSVEPLVNLQSLSVDTLQSSF